MDDDIPEAFVDLDQDISTRMLVIEMAPDGSLDCDTSAWPPWQIIGVAAWLDAMARDDLAPAGD